ncbi:MAG TPA: LCP family protein [Firmicutes bacterium]|nr:LCP family protein [Bacillota bacterium]
MLSEQEVLRRKAELERRRAWKKRYRRRQILLTGFALIVSIIFMVIVARYSYRQKMLREQPFFAADDNKIRILFLGTDEKLEANVRADTILLASLDPETGEVGLLSIPRDTRVWVEERQHWERVNAAYAYGGPALTVQAVSNLLQVPIPYYVQTDFQGFEKIVDILGGVEMDVAKEMHYIDKAQDLEIHILPGRQTLNGEKALQYVRYRDRLGDVALVDPFGNEYGGRVERQRQFFQALAAKILSPGAIGKLPRLVPQMFRLVNTNLPWEEVLSLTVAASKFSPDLVRTAVLPGNSEVIGDAWYWIVNEKKAQPVLDSLIWGKLPPLRVVVLNGNGRQGAAQEMADLLTSFGYNVVSVGNAEHFNFTQTEIRASARDISRTKALTDYLNAAVKATEAAESEITVIIGKDFKIKDRSVGI